MMSNSKYNSQKVHYDVSEPMAKTKRVWRLIKIWDLYRTFAKTVNRRSLPLSPVRYLPSRSSALLFVWRGQFGLSTAFFYWGEVWQPGFGLLRLVK